MVCDFLYRQILISQYNIEDNLLGVKIPDATTVLAENGTCLLFSNLLKYYLPNIIMKTT
jgi:hypothetical protein